MRVPFSASCAVDGCGRTVYARGLCTTHYKRKKAGAQVDVPIRPYASYQGGARGTLDERLWSKIAKGSPDECWEWHATKNPRGYGAIRAGGKGSPLLMAHRVAYESEHGEIPAGLVIDHLCRNPSCCNPAHLEAVTQSENVRRGEKVA